MSFHGNPNRYPASSSAVSHDHPSTDIRSQIASMLSGSLQRGAVKPRSYSCVENKLTTFTSQGISEIRPKLDSVVSAQIQTHEINSLTRTQLSRSIFETTRSAQLQIPMAPLSPDNVEEITCRTKSLPMNLLADAPHPHGTMCADYSTDKSESTRKHFDVPLSGISRPLLTPQQVPNCQESATYLATQGMSATLWGGCWNPMAPNHSIHNWNIEDQHHLQNRVELSVVSSLRADMLNSPSNHNQQISASASRSTSLGATQSPSSSRALSLYENTDISHLTNDFTYCQINSNSVHNPISDVYHEKPAYARTSPEVSWSCNSDNSQEIRKHLPLSVSKSCQQFSDQSTGIMCSSNPIIIVPTATPPHSQNTMAYVFVPIAELTKGSTIRRPESENQLQCENARCNHRKSWKRLRSKRGFAYFACYFCGSKWRINTTGKDKQYMTASNQENTNFDSLQKSQQQRTYINSR